MLQKKRESADPHLGESLSATDSPWKTNGSSYYQGGILNLCKLLDKWLSYFIQYLEEPTREFIKNANSWLLAIGILVRRFGMKPSNMQ